MHIPDGFIAPKMYIPAYAAAAGFWAYGIKRVKEKLDEEAIPYLAVLTALAFVLMMVAIPLPGGTTVHAAGIALLAILFGVWTSFISISMVLLLQSVMFGEGGITSLPINALAMGLIGSAVAYYVFRALQGIPKKIALFAAGWFSINVAAFIAALALGAQPAIAHSTDGSPLFFPFGFHITLPAVMVPHMLIGIGEGVLTVLVYQFVAKQKQKGEA
ncbi:MAG: cobalamin biosynthesis protein CbiM [Candidatus Latescibacteria bacterium]|nr:cobalamin biosynthesis protein CbiM [Candidatus Latescibacterota bacterium]NIO28457.1 cobalamin biosynthesis protein CbiM [Candidatus Latescibacterota bacterium]NIO56006.1 cobalamin biosynthesis protein CbiM [Candidatus Latescibacterota bacterium]NIT01970.1 cobalamin biosynthesis protein CbiM [Candidatus Latescibacterota bacterium]